MCRLLRTHLVVLQQPHLGQHMSGRQQNHSPIIQLSAFSFMMLHILKVISWYCMFFLQCWPSVLSSSSSSLSSSLWHNDISKVESIFSMKSFISCGVIEWLPVKVFLYHKLVSCFLNKNIIDIYLLVSACRIFRHVTKGN